MAPGSGKEPETVEEREQWIKDRTAWKKAHCKNYISQAEFETVEDYYTALDTMFPRMAESDEEGIDLNPADSRRRFIAVSAGAKFKKADPLDEEDLKELEKLEKRLNLR